MASIEVLRLSFPTPINESKSSHVRIHLVDPLLCLLSCSSLSVLRYHLQLELGLSLYDGLLKTLCCSCEYYQPLVHACWRAYLYLSLLFVCCLHRFAPNDKTTTTTHTQHTTQHNTHKHTHCSQSACSAVQCSVLGRGGTSSRAKESKKCVWATRWRMESVVCCWGMWQEREVDSRVKCIQGKLCIRFRRLVWRAHATPRRFNSQACKV